MDTINALHDAFKEATSVLQKSKDRVERLADELGKYEIYEKRVIEEEQRVAESIAVTRDELYVQQRVLEDLEGSCRIKELHAEVLNLTVEASPRVVCTIIDSLVSQQKADMLSLESLVESSAKLKKYSNTAVHDIDEARGMRKMLIEGRERDSHKLEGELQATLKDGLDTLHLLQACIDGMIRKNSLIRDREKERAVGDIYQRTRTNAVNNVASAVNNLSQPPRRDETINKYCPIPVVDTNYNTKASMPSDYPSHEARRRNSEGDGHKRSYRPMEPSFEYDNMDHPNQSDDNFTLTTSNYQPQHHQQLQRQEQYEKESPQQAATPWYKLNKKKMMVSSTTVTTPHGVVTTQETFRSATEIMEMQEESPTSYLPH